MKKIIIIGSRGFIGKYVLEEISSKKNIKVYEGYKEKIDILDIDSFKKCIRKIKPDVVINLAAFSHLDSSSYENIFQMNCFSLVKILDFLVEENFQGKFINTSSALVYGSRAEGLISEDSPLKPEYAYAVAKASIDHLIEINQTKLDIVSVRPFNCIGRGHRMDYVVPKIIKHFVEKKEEIELGNVNSRRDFVDVRDVARMYWTISKSNLRCPAVNLCSGLSTSILEIIDLLEEISNHKLKVKVNNKLLREVDRDNVKGDNSIIKSMGFNYRYPLKKSLKWMLENSN